MTTVIEPTNPIMDSGSNDIEEDEWETAVLNFKPTKNLICHADSHSSWSMTDKEINPSSPKGADLSLYRFKVPIAEVSPATTASVSPIPSDTEADEPIKQKKGIRNPYAKYPYFIASVKNTVAKSLFPKAEHPLGNLKESLKTPYGLTNFIAEVRNQYIKPLFYVLKSTAYFNPITKTRVPIKRVSVLTLILHLLHWETKSRYTSSSGFRATLEVKRQTKTASEQNFWIILSTFYTIQIRLSISFRFCYNIFS